MYIPGVAPISSMLAAELGHVGAAEFGIHGGIDQFHMMDPMEMRHGLFAWSGQNFSGGRIGDTSSKEITLTRQSLTQTLFAGYRAPTDGNALAQVAKHEEIGKLLQEGNVLGWYQDIEGEKIPCIFALCELPASPDQIFDTLLDVNGFDAWMPRANWFKSDDPDAQSLATMRKRFNGRRSARIDDIATRYKTSVPQFYGRLAVDYRQLSGGALQMEWNVHGDQTKPTDPKKIGLDTVKEIAGLKPIDRNGLRQNAAAL